jgi:hypothetical protein
LQIGETYAHALQLPLGSGDNEKKANEIADTLVYGYPHHLYPIDDVESKQIALNVSVMKTEEYEAALDVAEAQTSLSSDPFTVEIYAVASW